MIDTFIARAYCSVGKDNPEYSDGMRGAYVNIVCSAKSLRKAIKLMTKELLEIDLEITGFEFVFDERFLNRSPSEYERTLLDKLELYPVQFENVHYFPPDD